ncbi:MAG: hypothetical protein RLZ35_633, partial [Pseudomonadota bacterium]
MADRAYNATSIEVLSGLDPVRKRPGMYTDTARPNHLAQEVIDNSVDEAISGHANRLRVVLRKDGGLSVEDNGRGMPIDIHPEHKVPGIELILTRLHAGAKFSQKDYRFSGGLHGVGVSVVNALAKRLEVVVKRGGFAYKMAFEQGERVEKLKKIGEVPKKETGTTVVFWPEPKYFDSAKILASKLKQLLRAKAVLCPGLHIEFLDESTEEYIEWYYESGLNQYLLEQVDTTVLLPEKPFEGDFEGDTEAVRWAVVWAPEKSDSVQESFVNLVPTIQGGTH